MTGKDIFSIALGLSRAWQISDIRLERVSEVERELHIYLDFERGFKFLTRSGST
jgi:hypothetical protein